MNIEAFFSKPEEIGASTLIYFCHQDAFPRDKTMRDLDKRTGGLVKQVFESEEFTGKSNKTVLFHKPAGFMADRIILAGIGKKKNVTDDSLRQAAGTVSRLAAIRKSKAVAFCLSPGMEKNSAGAIVEGFILGGFKILEYKSGDDANSSNIESVYICTVNKRQLSGIKKAVSRGQIIAEGVILTRRLAADPSNSLTPKEFVSRATSLGNKLGFQCDAMDKKGIKKEKMEGLLAVARGSDHPPQFVILKYKGANIKERPIILIGKGITFDSGGISLKNALHMQDMKQDMTGAAIVLALIATAAKLGIKRNLIGLIPLAENMPSGKAYRPGDIIKMRNGKTVEVINTDSEGRIILADALSFAASYDHQAIIDIATLTGAAKYVLGPNGALIMGNNKKLMSAMIVASERSLELILELPILEQCRQAMKSDIADLKNSGGAEASTIKAAAFLESFVTSRAWVHFDIASVDLALKNWAHVPKGPTGFGFRLLIDLIANWKKV
jgi:leucyl aminopeptidase